MKLVKFLFFAPQPLVVNSFPALSHLQIGIKAEVLVSGQLIISAQRNTLQAGCLCPRTSSRAEFQGCLEGVMKGAEPR